MSDFKATSDNFYFRVFICLLHIGKLHTI